MFIVSDILVLNYACYQSLLLVRLAWDKILRFLFFIFHFLFFIFLILLYFFCFFFLFTLFLLLFLLLFCLLPFFKFSNHVSYCWRSKQFYIEIYRIQYYTITFNSCQYCNLGFWIKIRKFSSRTCDLLHFISFLQR